MIQADFVAFFQMFFVIYFSALTLGYLLLNWMAFVQIIPYMHRRSLEKGLPQTVSGFEIPVSVLVPAHNESKTIVDAVKALLHLKYPDYEIVVINDGSTDSTLDVLKDEFKLTPLRDVYWERLRTRRVRAIYGSRTHPNLRVLDKENGGKGDALNAGINIAHHPVICTIDSDSILPRDSLQNVIQPFLEDPTTVASGGTVRIINGCRVADGYLLETGIPSNLLALIQIVEYLRAFLFGRLGWSSLNALMVISGAYSVLDKEAVIEVGGYRTDLMGEDMELVLRLHSHMRKSGRKYRISYVPDPICWTEAPENLRTLGRQRIRWQRGLAEAMWLNLSLLFHPRGGVIGWLAFPFYLVFEFFGPVVESFGLVLTVFGWLLGVISLDVLLLFLTLAIGSNLLLSISALLLEEISFRAYPGKRSILIFFLVSFVEAPFYRMLNSFWRVAGLVGWAFNWRKSWGQGSRKGRWLKGTQDKEGLSPYQTSDKAS